MLVGRQYYDREKNERNKLQEHLVISKEENIFAQSN